VEASVHSYVDKMAAEFARADFAITCAGAGTLAELAAACLPCLLVPLASAAEDHQSANAAAYARDTGSLWVRENQWDVERLAADVFALLHCPEAMTAAATRCGRAGRPDAATAIVEDCEALLLRRRK
jgi:UDP-N-acetylglucosamine--N-acetylmuramyl-(pentapeptide) pyrophosphoryl-undecaprenol N-acetylglucosamine transferase